MIKYSFYKKNNVYYLQLYLFGKRVQKSTGASTKRDAESFARIFLAEQLQKQDSEPDLNFSSLIEKWVEYAQMNKKSFMGDIHRLSIIKNFFGESTPVEEIEPNKVQEFVYHLSSIKSRRGTPLSRATINRYIALLKVIFNHSIRLGIIDSNPVKVRSFKEKPRKKYYSEEELKRLLTTVDYLHKNARTLLQYTFKYVFLTALLTGMRLAEIINLKWDDLKDDCFHVYNNKEAVEKFVPVPNFLKKVLLELKKEDSVYVIPMVRRKSDAIRNTWNHVKKLARVEGRFHDLRRTYAVELMKHDVSTRIIQSLLGHQDIKTTQIYTPTNFNLNKKAVEKLRLPSYEKANIESDNNLKNNNSKASKKLKIKK